MNGPKLIISRGPNRNDRVWRLYCQECRRIRNRFEVDSADTYHDIVDVAVAHAWNYHTVLL